jgi:hypothetical protein
MSNKILQLPSCPVQKTFDWCIRSWLISPETPTLDVSQVPENQCELLLKALEEQEAIRWHLALCGYLSQYWGLAVMAYPTTAASKGKGQSWSRKTILQLWEFADAMWEHHNAVLHNHELEASCKIRDADINAEITCLYENVDSYAVEDHWYFDMPLALRLWKPLCSCQQWLVNARVLVSKSGDRINIGQVPLTTYFPPLQSDRIVATRPLGPVSCVVPTYVQTTLMSLFGRRLLDPTTSCLW